ncbi:hypothetical protein PHISCL_04934 [Aspergillus sclerotialis]|uniref:ATP-dependent RNA helicase n=1 Tax=Aspergillus sclerotialis TaxID=2070753 RepID=A0A3A2ZHM2_9EURO|nr:hypothetical protein PHISCL_04934 [Aspergillus sclerotialis]
MAGPRSRIAGSSKREAATDHKLNESQKRKRDQDSSSADSSKSAPAKKTKKTLESSSEHAKQNETAQQLKAPAEAGLQTGAAASRNAGPSDNSKKTPNTNDSAIPTEKKYKSRKEGPSGNDSPKTKASEHIEKADGATGNPDEDAKGPLERASSKNDKFSGIMSKFQKTAKVKEAVKAKKDGEDKVQDSGKPDAPEPVVAHGLEPLPQPEAAPEHVEKPTYSSLPEWLANPLKASVDEKAKFSELNIGSDLLHVLETNGYKEAFAVQSTVLPLLLPGPENHPGDLCISAATGSGKTLSYVLPLVNSLQHLPAPMLRGLIVVPTRELVKQARETCELLAAGSGLRIGSAIGNVPIKDEQQSLMRTDPYFSPEVFGQQQRGKLGGEHWVDFTVREYFTETEGHYEFLQDYIEKRDPNVDILICTPGRLVDHICFTKGFSLKHLEWLIIDEADRLLNESFQEWVGAVMTSLDARKAPETFGFSGTLLADMGLPIQRPEPKKVILSATMTRDISKLNSLRLLNPKMVIVGAEGNSPNGEFWQFDDHFTLPPTLKEHSISVGDGAEKPLYLLRLLRSHIKAGFAEATPSNDTSSESEDSTSGDTSSDEASETSSSDSLGLESSDDETSESEASSSEDEEDESKPDTARNTVLVFTKSSESASRLSRLLSILDPSLGVIMGTIIKSNKSSASRKTLSAYRKGKISIIVATDRASRGLDLRSLKHVVNYDVPHSITSYVHRVGRTARAGERGDAWTFVAHREGRWFGNQITKGADGQIVRSTKVEKVNMKLDGMAEARKKYASALEMLEKEVKTQGKAKE